jgi:hypothetical protein
VKNWAWGLTEDDHVDLSVIGLVTLATGASAVNVVNQVVHSPINHWGLFFNASKVQVASCAAGHQQVTLESELEKIAWARLTGNPNNCQP